VEWHLGFRFFFWCMVGNSLNPEDRSFSAKEECRKRSKPDDSKRQEKGPAQQIQKAGFECSNTNQYMLTFKHGTLDYFRARYSYHKDDSVYDPFSVV
jgi:hypothetical protein